MTRMTCSVTRGLTWPFNVVVYGHEGLMGGQSVVCQGHADVFMQRVLVACFHYPNFAYGWQQCDITKTWSKVRRLIDIVCACQVKAWKYWREEQEK